MKNEYEYFVETLRRQIADALGKSEEDLFLAEETSDIPGEKKLYVKCRQREDACELFGLYLEDLYEKYKNGTDTEEIVEEVVLEIRRTEQAGYLDKVMEATEYQKIKEKLFVRLVNAEKQRKELEHGVYRQIGDIALVLYMLVEEKDNRLASMKIRKEFMENWDMDKEQVLTEALLNTYYLSPPRLYRWEKLLEDPEYDGDNFMDLLGEVEMKKDAMGNCLSTTKRTNGAVAVFLPGVAKRIACLLDGSFYLVFTSIHEVMIHLDTMVHVEDLEHILEKTIEEATPAKDILTCKIYHYNMETECFSCVSQ